MSSVGWQAAGREGEYKQLSGLPALFGFIHGFGTRVGGCSKPPYDSLNLGTATGDDPENVQHNHRHFLGTLGCSATPLQTLKQVHSADVILIRKGRPSPGNEPRGDALVTDKNNLLLGVFTADCYPVLIVDPYRQVVAAVHAGWRGVAGRIVSRTVEVMKGSFGCRAESLLALIGPGIGPCCYQVGREAHHALVDGRPEGRSWFRYDPHPETRLGPTWRLDLQAAIRDQLEESGALADRVLALGDCTVCCRELYFSYRRDGRMTGRMLSVIGIVG